MTAKIEGKLNERNHGNSKRTGNLVKGNFHVFETEITHCHHQTEQNGQRKHSSC